MTEKWRLAAPVGQCRDEAPHRVARRLRQSAANIFLSSIFLSSECFRDNFAMPIEIPPCGTEAKTDK